MTQADDNKATYLRFMEILGTHDFDALPEVLDVEKYREVCVGVTQGWVDYDTAVASVRQIAAMMGKIEVDLRSLLAEGDTVMALAAAPGGDSNGSGAPRFMFDYVKLADGKIVERVQMADMTGGAGQQQSWGQ